LAFAAKRSMLIQDTASGFIVETSDVSGRRLEATICPQNRSSDIVVKIPKERLCNNIFVGSV
jgi:hypothetical protein